MNTVWAVQLAPSVDLAVESGGEGGCLQRGQEGLDNRRRLRDVLVDRDDPAIDEHQNHRRLCPAITTLFLKRRKNPAMSRLGVRKDGASELSL